MSMIVARNFLYPETKAHGYGVKRFVIFTSAHGHYSAEKAAQMFGFGSEGVKSVPVDEHGCMRPDELDRISFQVEACVDAGETPFYVNATAGTTVLGSFDPLDAIADICEKHKLWMHVDASWGGPVIFSEKQRHKMAGSHRADSIATCPHKMMNVPLTCTYLLGKDLRRFHHGMTLPAGYLFHGGDCEPSQNGQNNGHIDKSARHNDSAEAHPNLEGEQREHWDLADLTPQCGRRGDSLKLALSWIYYGTTGYAAYVDRAFSTAACLANLVNEHPDFSLVSENPPPCLQVCFYYRKQDGVGHRDKNSRITEQVSRALVPRGFMIDFAPGDEGRFFRVVVNGQTREATVEGLVKAIANTGKQVVERMS